MKRAKKLLVLLGILAVLTAGVIAAGSLFGSDDDMPDADDAIIPVVFSPGTLTAVNWQSGGATLSLEKGSDGYWFYADDPSFPLDQSYPEAMISQLEGLTASRRFDSSAGSGDYGLDDPVCIITAISADGASTVINIGNQNAVTREYYLTLGGGDNIFMVSEALVGAFPSELLDLAVINVFKTMNTINAITIRSGDKMIETVYDDEIDDDYDWFIVAGKDTLWPLSSSEMSNLKASVYSLRMDSCVNYKPSESDIAEYGLDKPGSMTVRYIPHDEEEEVTVTFLFGKTDDAGAYVRLEGEIPVYLADASVAEKILSADYSTLKPEIKEGEV
ncbi:MAG: DUF4340 domain-containing protein [Oscillospiraceae bacterium]|nr:DUF4340 domain-containing protein [Oscillospiraceae bacterium]